MAAYLILEVEDGHAMAEQIKVYNLDELLDASQAMPEFKEAVRDLSEGEHQDRIDYNWGAPPLKVMRVIMKILESCPREPIERVQLKGTSGCSDFTGTAIIEPGPIHIDFEWDCSWRAAQLGWKDFFGDPDQIRAAHEYDYQCFKRFDVKKTATATAVGKSKR